LIEASDHDSAALALLVQLVMALRSGEVLGLRTRDLDADATVLVVEGTKTRNARRRLEIMSAPLRHLLAHHCANMAPGDLIFDNGRTKPYCVQRLQNALAKYCTRAGVPVGPYLPSRNCPLVFPKRRLRRIGGDVIDGSMPRQLGSSRLSQDLRHRTPNLPVRRIGSTWTKECTLRSPDPV
jgi:integrase